ncbi:hypothetical protein MKX01_041356 [Papaver californicum]|nr:hypothetical protein MKX01_041356 [Papaver californicum]
MMRMLIGKKIRMIFNEMTLEEYLAKTGALGEEDVRIPTVVGPLTGFVVDSAYPHGQIEVGGSILGYGNGATMEGGRVVGRGKRRAVREHIDKVAHQRQRRIIKNRESAARSREKKQSRAGKLPGDIREVVFTATPASYKIPIHCLLFLFYFILILLLFAPGSICLKQVAKEDILFTLEYLPNASQDLLAI